MATTSGKNYGLVNNLMAATYRYRRQNILTATISVEKVLEEYPALQLVSEIKAEFSRILDIEKLPKKMVCAFSVLHPKVLSLARGKGVMKNVDIDGFIHDNPDRKSEVEETATIMAIPLLLRESAADSAVLRICSENDSIDTVIQETVFPRLVGSGNLAEVDPLYIAAEGKIVAKLSGLNISMPMALALLMVIYYVFNIEYPAKGKNSFAFLESVLLENFNDAKKKIVIQKLLKDLAA